MYLTIVSNRRVGLGVERDADQHESVDAARGVGNRHRRRREGGHRAGGIHDRNRLGTTHGEPQAYNQQDGLEYPAGRFNVIKNDIRYLQQQPGGHDVSETHPDNVSSFELLKQRHPLLLIHAGVLVAARVSRMNLAMSLMALWLSGICRTKN